MPRKREKIFTCTKNSMYASYRQLRKRRAFINKNDRLLRITFHDFRRFFATKYHATYLNLPKTQRALGHKNINNTMRYIADQEEEFQSSNYDVRVAISEEEIKKAGEDGYEHYDTEGERHFYRKRKL
jgi:integrase